MHDFAAPSLPQLLTAALALLAGVVLYFMVRAAARSAQVLHLARYFGQTFEDARERPDAKLVTLFIFTVLVAGIVINGLITRYWPPDYIFITLVGFVASGYGFSAFENRSKIQSEGQIEQAKITGQPAPAPANTTATTSTTTTIQANE